MKKNKDLEAEIADFGAENQGFKESLSKLELLVAELISQRSEIGH